MVQGCRGASTGATWGGQVALTQVRLVSCDLKGLREA